MGHAPEGKAVAMVETSSGELTTSQREDLCVMAVTNPAGGSGKTVRPQGRPEFPDDCQNSRNKWEEFWGCWTGARVHSAS